MEAIDGYETNKQPGRRFARNSSRGDHLLGLFGLVSHMFFFGLMATAFAYHWQDSVKEMLIAYAILSACCLAIRAAMVGSTTVKESIVAIKEAWLP